MSPAGPNLRQVHSALLSGFDRTSLSILLKTHFDADLDHVAGNGDFAADAWDVVRWANRQGKVAALAAAMQAENPDNAEVRKLAADARAWVEAPEAAPAAGEPAPAVPSGSLPAPARRSSAGRWGLAALGLVLGAALGAAAMWGWPRPQSAPPAAANPLVIRNDFEAGDDSWTRFARELRSDDGEQVLETANEPSAIEGSAVQGTAITGASSLQVTTHVAAPGLYSSYATRPGPFRAHGITLSLFVPEQAGVAVDYVVLCLPSAEWTCSYGVTPRPGEWTPLVIDLSAPVGDGPLYEQELTDVVIEWRFRASQAGDVEFYLDDVGFHIAGAP